MKNFLMLCCLALVIAGSAFAADKKPVDQDAAAQSLLHAKQNLEREFRITELEDLISQAKLSGTIPQALMNEYNGLLSDAGRLTPPSGSLDTGGEDCSDAVDLGSVLGNGIANGTTAGHANDFGDFGAAVPCYQGSHFNGSGAGPDVTYKWTAPRTSTFTFSLCGSSYDTELSLWHFTCPAIPAFPADYICGNDDPPAGNRCTSGGLHSVLTCISVEAGQQILIVVDGFSSNAGEYNLSIQDCNPSCADIQMNAPGTITGQTCDAGNGCSLRPSQDVIVEIVIPSSGFYSIRYDSPDYDTYLYLGSECCAGDICTNDDYNGFNSECHCLFLEQGRIWATLEAFSEGGCGTFTLNVSPCITGRCCYTNEAGGPGCQNTTLEDCANLGGAWSEGLNCDANPCPVGRCCYFSGGEQFCTMTGQTGCLYELGGEWSEGLTCNDPCPSIGGCGPIDLVFAVDITGSMQPAINNVIAEMPNIIAVANIASGFDLRLGLVTFYDDVHTWHNLTTDLASVQATIGTLLAGGGNNYPEASDEALREIITNDALCTDGSEFTSPFRAGATKLIVLITDASNGGCDDFHDASDDANAHQRALDAAAAGVRLCTVYIPTPFGGGPAVVLPIINDYALTSAGSVRVVALDGSGTGGAINQIIADCGQGELRLSAQAPDLRCDPNGGGITTPTFDVHVDAFNNGTAECNNAMLEITGVSGDGGTAVVNSANPVALGNIAINATVGNDFNVTVTPDADGGQIILTVNVTSDNCPPNFLDIVIDVPDCTPCDGDAAVYFFEDDTHIPPACICTYLCLGSPVDVFVCGEGFAPGRYPVLDIHPGCLTDDCQEECNPAQYSFSNTGWTIWGDTCWHNIIIPGTDGCICICFDRFLPVEMGTFAAVARDGEIQLNWNTASETDNDHFELLRDGMLTAQVAATNNSSGSHYSFVDRGLENGRMYNYELVSVDLNGGRTSVGSLETSPNASAANVTELALNQNYPNPFNPETNISFDLVESGFVTLKVYNAVGQEVALLVNGTMNNGRHTVVFDGTGLPSGLYFYRLTAGESTMQKKMLLLK